MNNISGNTKIIPAIMPQVFSDIENQVSKVSSFAEKVQIDIMDGKFVPSLSWPYGEGQWNELEKLSNGELKLDSSVEYEAHLMVNDPYEVGRLLASAGVSGIILQAETLREDDAPKLFKILRESGAQSIGISIKFETDLSVIKSYAHLIDSVQLMGIENIGYQGQSFNTDVIKRVAEAHAEYPLLRIAVDGGVGLTNIKELANAGAIDFVAGSAIFNMESPGNAYRELLEQAQ